MRQSLSEKVVTPTELKISPGFVFFFCRLAEREKKGWKKRETKGEWERCKFY